MKRLVSLIGLLSLSLLVTGACSETSPKLVPLPLVKKEHIRNIGDSKVSFNRALDILFVVDDSGSMADHQDNLSKNVKLFTQGIVNNQILDYHIGVTSSSMDQSYGRRSSGYGWGGELNGITKYVSRTTPNGAAELERNLIIGTDGSATEEFFTPAIAALSPPKSSGVNTGFFRPEAYLAVIFVTDADDQSKVSAQEFYNFLVNLKGGDATKIISYGVYIPTADKTCSRSGEPVPDKLEEFFRLTKAETLGLCDVDYGVKLADLGEDLVRKVGSVLYLTRPPQPETIHVQFGTQEIPNNAVSGWVYDPVRNALVFGDEIDLLPEPPGTEVEVNFTAAADFDEEE